MPTYSYKVRNEKGKLITGTADAVSKDALAASLRRSNYTIISIKEAVEALSQIDKFLRRLTRVKVNDLVMFNVQLSNMIAAGIPLPAALATLSEQVQNVKLKDTIVEVYDDIKGGSTFSDALKKHSDVFPDIFINMIRAGEVAGNLDEILSRLAIFFEKEMELKQKISAALFYPVILAVFGTCVVILIILTILPSFAKIFIEANVPLPLPTMVLYNLNLVIRAYWKPAVAAIAAAIFLLSWYKKTPAGKYRFDKFVISFPIWGGLVREVTIARLSRTLASLLASGVPMLSSLKVTEQTIDNSIISRVLKNVYSSVSKGETVSAPLKESGEFPPMPVHMVAVGEETGSLDVMLNKVADYYELSTDYSIKKLTALIEPIFLIILGGMVAFIFASILLPIFRMVKTLKH